MNSTDFKRIRERLGLTQQQIRDAVEKLYSVKVKDVRTMNRKGKPRRAKYKMTTTSAWKRASSLAKWS